jgi:RimJ/RimL family protein N-acetyltransferase
MTDAPRPMPDGRETGMTDGPRPMPDAPRPRPMVRGERVYLRPSERSDIPTFVRWFNDAETTSFLAQRAPLSIPLEERWFERMLEGEGKTSYHFVICLLDDDRAVGTIGLFDINEIDGSAGMGIAIGEKSLWGQGLGSDALRALLDFAFGHLRLERVWLDVYDFNERARRSYENCGFVLEGTKRRAAYRRGRFIDVHYMAILRDEWATQERKRSWEFDPE